MFLRNSLRTRRSKFCFASQTLRTMKVFKRGLQLYLISSWGKWNIEEAHSPFSAKKRRGSKLVKNQQVY